MQCLWWLALAAMAQSAASGEEQAQQAQQQPVLMLGWREFGVDLSRGEFAVAGQTVRVEEVPNSGRGTGLVVWDGSVVLAKHVEHAVPVEGARVLELGAGTGAVGLSCAALGAQRVFLTDLEYTLDNLRHNIALNAGSEARAEAFELDWFKPLAEDERLRSLDLVLAADVIWVPELVEPFVATLLAISEANPGLRGILLAHQTRALSTDRQLFAALDGAGFSRELVPADKFHPEYVSKRIKIFSLRRPVPN